MWILAPKNLLRICEICSGGRDWWGTMDMTVGWLVSLSKKWRRGALIVVSSVERYFLNKSLRDDAASVVQQYFWLSLLNYCPQLDSCRRSVIQTVFFSRHCPTWLSRAPPIALSRLDICKIHRRRIICLKLSILTCLVFDLQSFWVPPRSLFLRTGRAPSPLKNSSDLVRKKSKICNNLFGLERTYPLSLPPLIKIFWLIQPYFPTPVIPLDPRARDVFSSKDMKSRNRGDKSWLQVGWILGSGGHRPARATVTPCKVTHYRAYLTYLVPAWQTQDRKVEFKNILYSGAGSEPKFATHKSARYLDTWVWWQYILL